MPASSDNSNRHRRCSAWSPNWQPRGAAAKIRHEKKIKVTKNRAGKDRPRPAQQGNCRCPACRRSSKKSGCPTAAIRARTTTKLVSAEPMRETARVQRQVWLRLRGRGGRLLVQFALPLEDPDFLVKRLDLFLDCGTLDAGCSSSRCCSRVLTFWLKLLHFPFSRPQSPRLPRNRRTQPVRPRWNWCSCHRRPRPGR